MGKPTYIRGLKKVWFLITRDAYIPCQNLIESVRKGSLSGPPPVGRVQISHKILQKSVLFTQYCHQRRRRDLAFERQVGVHTATMALWDVPRYILCFIFLIKCFWFVFLGSYLFSADRINTILTKKERFLRQNMEKVYTNDQRSNVRKTKICTEIRSIIANRSINK